MRLVAILLCAFSIVFQLNAQDKQAPSPVFFIFDASGSMWGQMQGKTKMEIASSVLSSSIEKLPASQKIGLVAYGHRKKGDCTDVEFLVDVASGSKSEVSKALKGIKPLGKTPLAYSASQVIDALRASKTKATIILITDGIESCNGNICDVIKAAKQEGIDFRLHIIGFGLKAGETEQLECAASAGDGQYYDAADADGLGEVLNEATTESVDKPKGNFGVLAIKNGEAIDAYIKAYKAGTKTEAGTLRTYGETRYMYLPSGSYDLVAHPMGSDVNAITIKGEQSYDDKKTERTISFDGGKINANTTNNDAGWDSMVKVRTKDGTVAAATRTYGRAKDLEVNPGIYDVSFQALVMEGEATYFEIKDVVVVANESTPIEYNFSTGTIFIDAKLADDSIDTVVKIRDTKSDRVVASSRTYNKGTKFLLNPSSYEITVQPIGANKDRALQKINAVLKTGENLTKTLNF